MVVIRLPEFTVAEVFSVTTNDVNVKICCLCWSVTGQSIFCGTSDGRIIQCAPVSDAVKVKPKIFFLKLFTGAIFNFISKITKENIFQRLKMNIFLAF